MAKLYVSFILDETGSMQSVKGQTISGFNEYIKALKSSKENIRFTLTKFNSSKIEIVCDGVKIDEVKPLTSETYTPQSLTPLYDAIGKTIRTLETKLKKNNKALVVIQTDGLENCSNEYTRDAIFSMIEEKQNVGWTFAFLGADQDAWETGQSLGIARGNTMSYLSAETSSTFNKVATATLSYTANKGAQTDSLFKESNNNEIERIYYKHYRYKEELYKLGKYLKEKFEYGTMGYEIQNALSYTRGKTKWRPSCNGGKTECHIVLSNGVELVGIAECSLKDNFVYKIGRDIAYGRAMKQYLQYVEDYTYYQSIPF